MLFNSKSGFHLHYYYFVSATNLAILWEGLIGCGEKKIKLEVASDKKQL